MEENGDAASGQQDGGTTPPSPVAEMSLKQVLAFLQGLSQATFRDINQSYSRLVGIGLYEHGYSDADRDMALGIADTIKVQIRKTLADTPDALAEFDEAAAMQISQARFQGIGSSAWQAEERALQARRR